MILICGLSACEKHYPQKIEEGSQVTEINGSEILEGNNAVGFISNSKTGKGIPGVAVTDGYKYTVTDENGVYQMKANRYSKIIYYSLPAGYEVCYDDKYKGIPVFYSTVPFNYKEINRNDFQLQPLEEESENYTFVVIGDPQCRTDEHVARYKNETIADILKTLDGTGKYCAVTLGDITYDNPVQWVAMKDAMSGLMLANGTCLPVYQTIGNHDHDASAMDDEGATENYRRYFGPTDYSFNIGKSHIVSMDNVICKETDTKTWTYDGGFTESQYKWLQEDLECVKNKEEKLLIFCVHVPFRGSSVTGGSSVNAGKYYKEILSLLTQFKEVHIMAGHRHFQQNYIHNNYVCSGGLPIYEHIQGAACGSFWWCNLNLDGTPVGYNIYEIEGNTIRNWMAKPTNQSKDLQMRVYDGNQIYSGTKGYLYSWYSGGTNGKVSAAGNQNLKGCFVATIWNDDAENWVVELFQDGMKVGNLERLPDGSCCNISSSAFFFNEHDANNTLNGNWCTKEASHYWYIKAPGGSPVEEKNWQIVATQTIPSSGVINKYECSVLQTDFSEY